jgi:hypothetical protein
MKVGTMKTIAGFLLITFAASLSFAQTAPEIPQGLPAIQVIGVEIDRGPEMAAVQPTATLKFRLPSCAKVGVEAQVEEKDGKLFVSVRRSIHSFDCMGLLMNHDYSLQISSDYRNEDVIVLNPVQTFMR